MTGGVDVDFCVVGDSPGGLAFAETAARLGLRVALATEPGPRPPDPFLMLAALRAAVEAGLDLAGARRHAAGVAESAAGDGDPARLAGLGVRLLQGPGRIEDGRWRGGGEALRARRFLLARRWQPDLPALLTRGSFDGAGPFGAPLAQIAARLGLAAELLLPGGRPGAVEEELGRLLLPALRADGVRPVRGAVGEASPAVRDPAFRNPGARLLAIGPSAGRDPEQDRPDAAAALRRWLLRLPAPRSVPARRLPTWPEVATVGLDEAGARRRFAHVRVWRHNLAETDAALAAGRAEGLVKVVTDGQGRVLGAAMVGAGAGEAIAFWGHAVARRARLASLAGLPAGRATLAEAGRELAAGALAPRLATPGARRLLRLLARLP